MKRNLSALFLLVLISHASAATFIDALAMKESGNKPLPAHKDVNGVIVLGYFQISKAYWQDAINYDPSIGGTWERCQYDRPYAVKIVNAYMSRYKATTDEMKARTHNAGPMYTKSGSVIAYKVKATDAYWNDIKKRMNKGN